MFFTGLLPTTNDSDADFRAWGLAYANALNTVGLIQTADTGQIDFNTVTRPLSNNTPAGYQIWRFMDSPLQTLAPIFIKIEYGRGNSISDGQLWFTVGSGSDGTGNITDIFFARRTGTSENNTHGTQPAFFCHTEGCLSIAWGFYTAPTGPGLMQFFNLQRSTEADGSYNDFGVDLIISNSNSAAPEFQSATRFSPQAYSDMGGTDTYLNCILPFKASESNPPDLYYDHDLRGNPLPDTYHQVFPVWTLVTPYWPLISVLTVVSTDPYFNYNAKIGEIYSIKIGNFPEKNYILVGGSAGAMGSGASSKNSHLMLWE